jgi:nitroreductase
MPKRNYHAYDSGMAVMSLVLQAEYMGMRAHQMAGWRTSKVRMALSIPEPQKILAVVAVGYQETNPERLAQIIEENPRVAEKIARSDNRTRNPIPDFVFDGVYGNPYSPA